MYVDGTINLAPGTFDCAAATCAPGDRIINCDSATFNPSRAIPDPNTLLFSAIGLRDPEDDTPDNVLSADTCVVCFSNFNDLAIVQILARAVCVVGARNRSLALSQASTPSRRPSADDVRALIGRLAGRGGAD